MSKDDSGVRVIVRTRLGRAINAAHGGLPERMHREEHRQTNWLRNVILGTAPAAGGVP